MFNAPYRVYLFAFLIFCVLSSKNIIIYNEETLVALSFVLFVLFVFHYFGNTLKESLDERSESIKAECQNFLHYKEESLDTLHKEHKKIGHLKKGLSQLMDFTKETTRHLTLSGGDSLQGTFSQQMIQKCITLRSFESNLQQKLQNLMATNQLPLVLVHCTKQGKALTKGSGEKSNQLDGKVLQNAIALLISSARRVA